MFRSNTDVTQGLYLGSFAWYIVSCFLMLSQFDIFSTVPGGCVTAVLGEQLFLPSSYWDKLYHPTLGIPFQSAP